MVRRLPPLNGLRAFEAAARHNSFVGAAEELNVTPAAISHQVKGLEDYLDVALFLRQARGLSLTDAGQAYAPELTKGFTHLARAENAIRERSPTGTLNISVLPSFCNLWLAPRLERFHNLYPDVKLRVISETRTANFARDGVDIAIRHGFGEHPGLWSRQLFKERVFLVCSPTYLNNAPQLQTLADLSNHVLLHDFDTLAQEQEMSWQPWLRSGGLPPALADKALLFNELGTMYNAASNGLGVALGRSVLVSDLLESGRLVRVLPDERPAEAAYYAVTTEANTPGAKNASRKVTAFIHWMLELAGAAT